MEQKTLQAETRTQLKSAASRRLRRAGKIPGVIYGSQDPISIMLDAHEFRKQFRVISESQIIRLTIDGKDHDVLIKDYQEEIITGALKHIDFYEIEKGKMLRTNVALHIEGSAIGAREGGILEHQLHSIEVECLPKDIPDGFSVNVEELDVGHSIHVSGIAIPKGVKILNNLDQVVVIVAAARAEIEEAEEEEEIEGEEGEEVAEGAEEETSEE
ncbi:MAG: 50S ribosomal protein L25 [Spirochaetia bacterium]